MEQHLSFLVGQYLSTSVVQWGQLTVFLKKMTHRIFLKFDMKLEVLRVKN